MPKYFYQNWFQIQMNINKSFDNVKLFKLNINLVKSNICYAIKCLSSLYINNKCTCLIYLKNNSKLFIYSFYYELLWLFNQTLTKRKTTDSKELIKSWRFMIKRKTKDENPDEELSMSLGNVLLHSKNVI